VSAVSADPVTVSVAEDPAALAGKVKSFVDAVNAALGELDKQLSTGISGGTPGALPADGPMRSLRDRLLAAVTYGVPGSALGSGGLAGIQSTREGMLTFDEAAFTDALTADPTEVEKLFRSADPDVPAIADRVVALATDATRSGDGIIASATASRESQNTTFTSQIEAIDRRIELRRATMQRQWAAVEVAMGAMQAQQSWLSSQIGVLNANNTASR
jgi:flagellar hook-associated protein 2